MVYSRQVGDIEQARKLADLIAQGSHGDVHIQLLRFDLAKEAKDYGSMEGILAEIEKVSGRSAMWCYAKAVSLVLATRGKEKDPESKALLTQAHQYLKKAPSNSPRGFSR